MLKCSKIKLSHIHFLKFKQTYYQVKPLLNGIDEK